MVVEARYSHWPNGQLRLRRAILVSRVWGMFKNMAMGCHGSSKFTPLQSCMYRCLCMLKIAEACMAQENWERSTCGPQPSSCFISWSHCQSVQTIYSTAIYHKLFHGAICAISSIDIWQPGPSSTSGSKSGLTPAAQVMGPKASGGTTTSWEMVACTALHLTLVFPCKSYQCIYSTYVHLLRESSWHGFWPTLLPGCWEHVALRCKAVASDVAESLIVLFFLLHCTSWEVATEIFHNMCSGDTASICKLFVLGC